MAIPTRSKAAALAIGASAALVTAASVIPAMADGSSPSNPGPGTFVASAPCSGKSQTSLTWKKGATAADDVVIARMTHGVPGARWQVQFADYSGDVGSVSEGPKQANQDGSWRVRFDGSSGHHRLELLATSATGQVCAVNLEGQLRPLP
jgi:hypothetical protein